MRKIDPVVLCRLYADDIPNREIAEKFGCNKSSVDRMAKRLGLSKARTGPKAGARHPNWKGGRKRVGRYWYIYQPDHPARTKQGYVLEHRLVMEQILRRHLRPGEVVHHVDGDNQNNDPGNLALYPSNAAHLAGHFRGDREHARRISEGMKKSEKWARIRHLPPKRRGQVDTRTSDRQPK